MILTDFDILHHLSQREASKTIEINPFDSRNVQPCSYDVTLADDFLVPNSSLDERRLCIDPSISKAEVFIKYNTKDADHELILYPREFILGRTIETIKLPANIMARVEGKSSLARHGLAVHITAGHIDPGFEGTITLELFNHSRTSLILTPGMTIGQLVFYRLHREVQAPYGSAALNSKYQGQKETTASKYHENYNDETKKALYDEIEEFGEYCYRDNF